MAKLKNNTTTKKSKRKGAKKDKDVGKKKNVVCLPQEDAPLLDPRYVNLVRLCFVKLRRPRKIAPLTTQDDLPKPKTLGALQDQCTTTITKAAKKHTNSTQKLTKIISPNIFGNSLDGGKTLKEPLLDPRYQHSVRLCYVKLHRFDKLKTASTPTTVSCSTNGGTTTVELSKSTKSISTTRTKSANSVGRCFVKLHRFAEHKPPTRQDGLRIKETLPTSTQNSVQIQTVNTAALTQNQNTHRTRRAGNAFKLKENVGRNSENKENKEHSSKVPRSCPASSPLVPASKVTITNNKRIALIESNQNKAESTARHRPFTSALTSAKREDMRKLSLTKRPNNNPAASTPLKENEISHFAPLRNSTLHECDLAEAFQKSSDIQPNNPNLEKTLSEKHSSSTENIEESAPNKSQENFINKTDEIEQILLSMEEDDVETAPNNEPVIAIVRTATTSNTTHKFFHRKDDIISSNIIPKPKAINRKKILSSTKNDKQRSTLKRKSSVGKVYDFLSQSQSSDSDTVKNKDPAADIIRRMIDEGKVQVATMHKGTGKPIMKRKKRLAPKKLKNVVTKKPLKMPDVVEILSSSDNEHESDDIDYDANLPLPDNNEVEPTDPRPVSSVHRNSNARQKHDNSNEGTFSRLARSVLIHQAEKSDTQRTKIANKQRLLEVARKFVSTPVNRKLPPPTHTSNLSPISAHGQSNSEQAGNASPWRVNDDANLPSVSYFSRNSVNEPSFSSDFIPATPTKNKSIRQLQYSVWEPLDTIAAAAKDSATVFPVPPFVPSVVVLEPFEIASDSVPVSPVAPSALEPPENTENTAAAQITTDSAIPLVPIHGNTLSSFSSNDSNGENMRPPTPTDENAKEFDESTDISLLRHLPNPRRTLNKRSPLKAIDILEVVTLPSWKNTENNVSKIAEKSPSPKIQATNNISNLFGFEDDDNLSDDDNSYVDHAIDENSENINLRNKLQELRKIRPADEELIMPIAKPIRGVFDEIGDKPKQRGIKEMLCSTMLNEPQPSTSHNCAARNEAIEGYFNRHEVQEQQEASPEDDMSELFTSMPRTYVRPRTKRKRKLRHNFVMFLDSDDSGEEETEPEKKKRQKREGKPNPELNTFVNEFNEMCKDVERYEIVVERSA